MDVRRQRPWMLLVIAAGVMMAALILLYVTHPSSTVLTVHVVDARTEEALPGAAVQAQASGEQPLPTVATDETGLARFEDVPPDPAYLLRIQKVDYDLTFQPEIVVLEGRDTEVKVPLNLRPGERLFVGLDGARVAELDTSSLLMVQTTSLPGWRQEPVSHLSLHPHKDLLYAVTGGVGCVLDSRSGAVLRQFQVGGSVESMGVTRDGQHLTAVIRQEDGSAQLVNWDANTGDLLTRMQAVDPLSSTRFIWIPAARETYVVEPSQRALWVLDMEAQQALGSISMGEYPAEGMLSADGHSLYTWSPSPFGELQVAFGAKMHLVSSPPSLPVNGSAWTLSPTGQDLYVLDAQLGTLSILDLSGHEPPTLVAVGKGPEALVISRDGGWAYVANRQSRTISVVYLPLHRVVQTIPVLGEPVSLALRDRPILE